jgi:uncharacterized membrane protein (UPF0127 family)
MKSTTLLTATICIGCFVLSGLLISKKLMIPELSPLEQTSQQNPMTPFYPLTIGKSSLQVEIRRTEAEQALGLSWRKQLATETGMVFVYSPAQRVMFWMKGMQFPLDFIFVRDGKVVQIVNNVPAPSQENQIPKTIVPEMDVDMVIEVNAGWVLSHGVMVGDAVVVKK